MNKEVLDFFKELPEVKRLHELEPYIEGSKRIQDTFNELKAIQKKIVNSREYKLSNLNELEEEYNAINERLLDIPFVEEYLELVDYINNMLKDFSYSVEELLSQKING